MNGLPCIICASGSTVPFDPILYKEKGQGLPDRLVQIISHNYSFGLNYWYKFGCEVTTNCFVDKKQFHDPNYKELGQLPFMVGKSEPDFKKAQPNTILLPSGEYFLGMDSWDIAKKICLTCSAKYELQSEERKCPKCKSWLFPVGFYTHHLCGLFTLTLAIALGFKEIWLLGYDCTAKDGKTHFYQELVNAGKDCFFGVGQMNVKGNMEHRTSTYNSPKNLNEQWFAPYRHVSDVKIYNVSDVSVLRTFPKKTYEEFYQRFSGLFFDQTILRQRMKANILFNLENPS